jgi:PAS domain-containing protein
MPDKKQEYFEALFEQNPTAMVSVDMDGNVVRWNPAVEELFGYSQEEAVGKNVDDLVANHDSIRAEATKFTDQLSSLDIEKIISAGTERSPEQFPCAFDHILRFYNLFSLRELFSKGSSFSIMGKFKAHFP